MAFFLVAFGVQGVQIGVQGVQIETLNKHRIQPLGN